MPPRAKPAAKKTAKKQTGIPLTGSHFLVGAAGTGKTTEAADYLSRLLDAQIPPEQILILIPQRTLGRIYQQAAYKSGIAGSVISTATIARLAYDSIARYWPKVAVAAGFASIQREPTFLTIETAQYFMARFATEAYDAGRFEGVRISLPRVISQTFDNLSKAALLDRSVDVVAGRLIAAWGDRQTARPGAYLASAELARAFRSYCLTHNLIDVSLALELFKTVLCPDPTFQADMQARYRYLIADNIEEDNAAAHDFIRWLWPTLNGALLIYDTDSGFRAFLGAEPESAYELSRLCTDILPREQSKVVAKPMAALIEEFDRLTGTIFPLSVDSAPAALPVAASASNGKTAPKTKSAARPKTGALAAFQYELHTFYPQMIDWTVETVRGLIKKKTQPREIAVIAPFLSDSLRFALTYPLAEVGIPTLSHRPSRALIAEPTTRALITLARLAYPSTTDLPDAGDVANALNLAIAELDPLRARLLVSEAYGHGRAELKPFAEFAPEKQTRISYRIGDRYERLRTWLIEQPAASEPLDRFWRLLLNDVLAQPGFGFHHGFQEGRTASQLIESAYNFRATLYPDPPLDWTDARKEYFALIDQGLLAALYAQSWQDEDANAVFIAPAITFLLRNRVVEHQIWLDVGSPAWGMWLEQPLTNAYALRSDFTEGDMWTDNMEQDARQERLHNVMIGLARRCRKQIYLGICDLGEQGEEHRGRLLDVFQRIVERYNPAPFTPDEVS